MSLAIIVSARELGSLGSNGGAFGDCGSQHIVEGCVADISKHRGAC